MKRAKRKKSNAIKISFAATIVALSLVTVIAYYFSFGVPQYSVPSNIPPYGGMAGMYGPADALQVNFANYSAIRAINSSAVPDRQLLDLTQLGVMVLFKAVSAQVLVTLLSKAPKINNSATVAVVSAAAFSNLTNAFASSGMTPVRQGAYSLYNLTDSANGRVKNVWITLVPSDSAVVFSEGTSGAEATVNKLLGVREGTTPSILTLQNVTRMLYTIDGTDHLAFSIQAFPGQVLTSDMGVVAVDVASGSVQLSNVVRFTNSSLASSQTAEVKSVYRYAADFSQYAECIKAIETYSFTNLQQAVGLAGG